MAPASVKDELHQLIDAMDATDAVRLLAMISLIGDDGEVTPEEEAEILEGLAALERGDVIDGKQLERELGFEL